MDNVAAISNIRRGDTTQRNKYFRIRSDARHDAFLDKLVEPKHMASKDLPADALTKSLSGPQLLRHKRQLNVYPSKALAFLGACNR